MTRLAEDKYTPQEAPDRIIDTIGLVDHPTPAALADHLEQVASLLRTEGATAVRTAPVLAARGWPAATLGDGTGSKSANDETSVERAHEQPHAFAAADVRLAWLMRTLSEAGLKVQTLVTDLTAHATDVDPTPAGTGDCERCGTFCRSTKSRPNNRLRAGLCRSCYGAWDRLMKATRGNPIRPVREEWIRAGRAALRKGGQGALDDIDDARPAPVIEGCPHRCCELTSGHTHWHEPDACPACADAAAA